jgi:CTP:molybdopterin cytidylyltransferase MocA
MPAVKIAAVVLAAGASTRLGRPKQIVVIDGETLVERAVRTASAAGLSPVILVVADKAREVAGAQSILNPDANEGIASSIRCGVNAAAGCDGVVLMTCDQPALTADHLRALCGAGDAAMGSAYAGKVGIPAYFPASMFGELMQLEGDTGARGLLSRARSISAEELSFDIDTEEDIARLADKIKSSPL